MPDEWSSFLSLGYPELYPSFLNCELAVTIRETKEEKFTSFSLAQLWRKCVGLTTRGDEDTIIERCARYVIRYN